MSVVSLNGDGHSHCNLFRVSAAAARSPRESLHRFVFVGLAASQWFFKSQSGMAAGFALVVASQVSRDHRATGATTWTQVGSLFMRRTVERDLPLVVGVMVAAANRCKALTSLFVRPSTSAPKAAAGPRPATNIVRSFLPAPFLNFFSAL